MTSKNDNEGPMLKYKNVELGVCSSTLYSGFEFNEETVWLYERAEEDYREALDLDSTYSECYVELSELLSQLGKQEEAEDKLNKALSILNKAIQVDHTDNESYLERATVFYKMHEIESAIADLECALKLETTDYRIEDVKDKIEALREKKAHSVQ